MAANTRDAVSAGHTEGELIFDLHNTYRNGGRTYAYIRRPGDIAPVGGIVLGVEGMPEDRDTGRTMVAAFNSYRRHFGPRAIEAAEADLLGRALEALRMAAPLLAEAREALCGRDDVCTTSDGDDALLPLRDAINFILSQAREVK